MSVDDSPTSRKWVMHKATSDGNITRCAITGEATLTFKIRGSSHVKEVLARGKGKRRLRGIMHGSISRKHRLPMIFVNPIELAILMAVAILRTLVWNLSFVELRDETGSMCIARLYGSRELIMIFRVERSVKVYVAPSKEYVLERLTSLLYDFLLGRLSIRRACENYRCFHLKPMPSNFFFAFSGSPLCMRHLRPLSP